MKMFGRRKPISEVREMPKGDEILGFLGKETEFNGQLKFDGTLRIDGIFKGEIQAGGTLTVGEGACVEADIRCDILILHGEVIGNIQATRRLEATAPAKIRGDIQTPALVINEGVTVDGAVKMNISEEKQMSQESKITFLGKKKANDLNDGEQQLDGI